MRDVRRAGFAKLPLMSVLGKRERALDQRDVGSGQVVTEMPGEVRNFRHAKSS